MENKFLDSYDWVVDPNQSPLRLDHFLAEKVGMSRTKVQLAIKEEKVLVNGKVEKKNSYLVQPQDQLHMRLPKAPSKETIVPENIPLDIFYEDEALLVVNKTAPMVVHPAHGHWEGTLVNALLYKFQNLPQSKRNEGRPGLLHRIDKGTSGLLLIAKTEEALSVLSTQFMQHQIERVYEALVWGNLAEDQGTLDTWLGRDPKDRRLMKVFPDENPQGKRAITHYQVKERLGYVTLIQCRLETGRTHQIRAHMKHLGHPLFGDPRYGGDQVCYGPQFSKYTSFVKNNFKTMPYQALHAKTLGFIHPLTQKKVSFSVEAPPIFQEVLTRWRTFAHAQRGLH